MNAPQSSRSPTERSRVAEILRDETVGGALLLGAAAIALIWANSPWSASYFTIGQFELGPAALHLNLSISSWAEEGLMAIFFFVAGLELAQEVTSGELHGRRRAAVPVAAAVGGMVVPAAVYAAVNLAAVGGDLRGWAIPAPTDIAFALAVLAVIGSHLPAQLRAFLLALAVVDDFLAIVIIATFFSEALSFGALAAGIAGIGVFAVAVRRAYRPWWLLVLIAIATWILFHSSGIHATVAGAALGLVVPTRDEQHGRSLSARYEHILRPVSAGLAAPVFAFVAAGVTVGGLSGLGTALSDPVAMGVVLGLLLGKPIGVFGATVLFARYGPGRLEPGLGRVDLLGIAVIAGIGFTVSLLIVDLAYGSETVFGSHATLGVLVGSSLSAAVGAVILSMRNRTYRMLTTTAPSEGESPERSESEETERGESEVTERSESEETERGESEETEPGETDETEPGETDETEPGENSDT
ncbi:Na+/H+ antiporter NhaA [Rhodococcus spongiicola]|uniref:Na(+)/H(+) antiporter NhaA n=1 Tax=Rhodococcus spongiicola TaxID=2487352 RepID=A0A438AU55_9NOCA|nr:Na+/H+ antiporter NhaA [Rhodococcus spongiicola]RVW02291.1 Na+/H+ antiporter NhaA [Rhodococcus spongiicola]